MYTLHTDTTYVPTFCILRTLPVTFLARTTYRSGDEWMMSTRLDSTRIKTCSATCARACYDELFAKTMP
eukprot:scaffold227849_cov19-Prasinocladus_malaysianus.AAC.1